MNNLERTFKRLERLKNIQSLIFYGKEWIIYSERL
uniref:Uncharacterized protein n=1 Tax=virus sp. ctiha2 TaxID=2827299 RepID=A0A8S5RG99_9VIRU|nr:MAG TPA: hypothetical protein [virus sp. ctiha2]